MKTKCENRLIKEIISYLFILIGSILYALSTVLFIFPNSLLLGGTSGISVILNSFIDFSPGMILTVINTALIVLAFIVLTWAVIVTNAVIKNERDIDSHIETVITTN